MAISSAHWAGFVRWPGARAEALGVEIHPRFAATEEPEAIGIVTGGTGVGRDGHPKMGF